MSPSSCGSGSHSNGCQLDTCYRSFQGCTLRGVVPRLQRLISQTECSAWTQNSVDVHQWSRQLHHRNCPELQMKSVQLWKHMFIFMCEYSITKHTQDKSWLEKCITKYVGFHICLRSLILKTHIPLRWVISHIVLYHLHGVQNWCSRQQIVDEAFEMYALLTRI